VLLDNETEAILRATRLSSERIHFRIAMPKFALVQEGVVDYSKTPALADTFEVDGWKDRSLRTYRTVGGGSGGEGAMNCVHVAPNKSLERTVNHRGRTVRAVALCARAGAEIRSRAAVQRNR
jgi:hypothetical protein